MIIRLVALIPAALLVTCMPFTTSAATRPASCGASSSHHLPTGSSTAPVVVIGVQGGNIRPWSVGFNLDGSITATGITARTHPLSDARNSLLAFLKLADAEGFYSLPSRIACSGTLPDIGSRYIELHTSSGIQRVTVHGGCNSRFNQIWDVLQAAASID